MTKNIAIIGSGPAGLIAAEMLSDTGHKVVVYERKPSAGRKFLMAGRGGLNLTHSEDFEKFIARYAEAAPRLKPALENFPPQRLREWCEGLGQETFVGSSGRVFPKAMKASPLLRAWLQRLEERGVNIRFNADWRGWDEAGRLSFTGADPVKADATLLALGGASWPRLGSDGSWTEILAAKNLAISPLRPANCGFEVAWSDIFKNKFAGQPLKSVVLSFEGQSIAGEAMISARGIEGGAVYALSALLREALAKQGKARLHIDLRPGVALEELAAKLETPMRGKSFSEFMRKEAGLSPIATSLLREAEKDPGKLPPARLAALIKALPLVLAAPFPIDRAISSAGGIRFDELDGHFMLQRLPGVFAAGEMLDWEAPTGGYLLQASFATGVAAARGMTAYLS